MQNKLWVILFLIILLLSSSNKSWGESNQPGRVLVVDGHVGKAEVIQRDGHAYVDLQALVEITNGSLSFRDGRIVLSLPSSSVVAPVPEPTPPSVPQSANEAVLSRDFMRAGIEEIATMREWASTLAYAIQNNYHVTEDWIANYREQAASNLRLASTAASTEGDRRAQQLLSNEFDAVRIWSDKLVQARKSMDTAKYATSADALRNEPLSQKIVTCGRFLASMLGGSTFQDDPSCH